MLRNTHSCQKSWAVLKQAIRVSRFIVLPFSTSISGIRFALPTVDCSNTLLAAAVGHGFGTRSWPYNSQPDLLPCRIGFPSLDINTADVWNSISPSHDYGQQDCTVVSTTFTFLLQHLKLSNPFRSSKWVIVYNNDTSTVDWRIVLHDPQNGGDMVFNKKVTMYLLVGCGRMCLTRNSSVKQEKKSARTTHPLSSRCWHNLVVLVPLAN